MGIVAIAVFATACGSSDARPRAVRIDGPQLPHGVAEVEGSQAWVKLTHTRGWTAPKRFSRGEIVTIGPKTTLVTVYRAACPCPDLDVLSDAMARTFTHCSARIPAGNGDVVVSGSVRTRVVPTTCTLTVGNVDPR